jgi:hypothetical protein
MWNLPDALTNAIRTLTRPAPKPAPAPAPTPAPTPRMQPDQVELAGPPPGLPRATGPGAAIALQNVQSGWVKDPAFANDGKPIGGQRYLAFGDLRNFYLKGFDAGANGLNFKGGERPIKIDGLPGHLDGLWAPEITVKGDQVLLTYCAGEMHPDQPINWPSFRLRTASMPLAEFEKQAQAGGAFHFRDHGALFGDQVTFGGEDGDFGMIDPQLFNSPDGKAYMTYTVVKAGIPGKRPHEEFVRIREVDPNDPSKPVGPDLPLVDGKAGGPHDGVAEAQELVTIQGKSFLIISSRAGDKDQRILAAPFTPGQPVPLPPEAFKPVLDPGGPAWKSHAVGSTSTAVIDGKPYMLHQGMNADKRFTLGWTPLAMDG